MCRSGRLLPVTSPEMRPVPARSAGAAGRDDVPGTGTAARFAGWSVTGASVRTWPAPTATVAARPEPAVAVTACPGPTPIVAAWSAPTCHASAWPGVVTPPDHWSRYRPGWAQSTKCSRYRPGRRPASTYRPSGWLTVSTLPGAAVAWTQTPASGQAAGEYAADRNRDHGPAMHRITCPAGVSRGAA